MNILILEDTNTFVEEFVDILKNNNLFADAHFFCLGDHFEKIDDTKDYQVIFIDVHLSKSINGIVFSIELKKRFPKALIVFVTMNNNFVHKSMELQPFYFIRKDHLNEDMSIFFKMFKEHLENTSFIVINAREKHVRINTSDIIYIEADGHYLKIVTLDGEYKFKEKIKEFLNNFDKRSTKSLQKSLMTYLFGKDFEEIFKLFSSCICCEDIFFDTMILCDSDRLNMKNNNRNQSQEFNKFECIDNLQEKETKLFMIDQTRQKVFLNKYFSFVIKSPL